MYTHKKIPSEENRCLLHYGAQCQTLNTTAGKMDMEFQKGMSLKISTRKMTWLQTNIAPKENVWLKSCFSSYFSDIYFSISCSSSDLWHHKGWQFLGLRLCMYLVFRATPNHGHSHPSPKYKISLHRPLNKGSSFLCKEKPDWGQAGYERKGSEGKKEKLE